jgi:hypothetical protein
MGMIQIATTIEQYGRLKRILPKETADMSIWQDRNRVLHYDVMESNRCHYPAWSLSALLSFIPQPTLQQIGREWVCTSAVEFTKGSGDTPFDACVLVIEELYVYGYFGEENK